MKVFFWQFIFCCFIGVGRGQNPSNEDSYFYNDTFCDIESLRTKDSSFESAIMDSLTTSKLYLVSRSGNRSKEIHLDRRLYIEFEGYRLMFTSGSSFNDSSFIVPFRMIVDTLYEINSDSSSVEFGSTKMEFISVDSLLIIPFEKVNSISFDRLRNHMSAEPLLWIGVLGPMSLLVSPLLLITEGVRPFLNLVAFSVALTSVGVFGAYLSSKKTFDTQNKWIIELR
jgi:hypothetical protein